VYSYTSTPPLGLRALFWSTFTPTYFVCFHNHPHGLLIYKIYTHTH